MIVKLYEKNSSERDLSKVKDVLVSGGVIIYPTDSVYAFGCSLTSVKGIEKLKQLCGKSNHELAIVCENISQIAEYCRIDNVAFKILKRNLPGAITFILNASARIPEKAIGKRKTIGVRIPDNPIANSIIEYLGAPIVTASVKSKDEESEYTTDPELIHEEWGSRVDLVIDGGIGYQMPSTVVDLSQGEIDIIREGAEELK